VAGDGRRFGMALTRKGTVWSVHPVVEEGRRMGHVGMGTCKFGNRGTGINDVRIM
jgi:hypothetical protein